MNARPLSVRLEEALAGELRLPLHLPIARQGLELLAASGAELDRLSHFAGLDPVLAATLLRAANSAFYQGLPKVSGVGDALVRIGPERAVAALQRACDEAVNAPSEPLLSHYLPGLWRHSCGCALGARWLAERCGYRSLAESAYLAGLLHDIGKFSLLAGLGQLADDAATRPLLGVQLIEEVLASRHVEAGLLLHAGWNLPDTVAAVIAGHHCGGAESQEPVVLLVSLANQGCRKLGLGLIAEPELVLPTMAEAQLLGIDEITLAEMEIMLEDRFM